MELLQKVFVSVMRFQDMSNPSFINSRLQSIQIGNCLRDNTKNKRETRRDHAPPLETAGHQLVYQIYKQPNEKERGKNN